jgi:hypothetical protein
MTFMEALTIIQDDGRCTRDTWGSDEIFVHFDALGTISMTRPLGPREAGASTYPWTPDQSDMLSTDWRKLDS